jgi:4'-phosphopantetheinyl transferase
MCGISPTRIGVDVEQMLPIPLSDFESHFTREEFLHMQEAPNPLLTFYTYWTQKEAVLKAMGTGLSVPLIDITLKDKLAYYQQNPWNLHSSQLPDGSVYTVAFQGDGVVVLEGVYPLCFFSKLINSGSLK